MNTKPIRDRVTMDLNVAAKRVMTGDEVVRIDDAKNIAFKAINWTLEWAQQEAETKRAALSDSTFVVARIAGYLYGRPDVSRLGPRIVEGLKERAVSDAIDLLALATTSLECTGPISETNDART